MRNIVCFRTSNDIIKFARLNLVLVFTLSLVINITFLVVLPESLRHEEFSDFLAFYEPVARNIINGHGITLNGEAATFQGPGLPVILAVLFSISNTLAVAEDAVLLLATLLCNGTTSVIVYLFVKRLWNERTAIVTSLIWIVYPLNLWFLQQFSSEVPFMVTVYVAIYLLWRLYGHSSQLALALVSGAVLGISALIRPISIALPIIPALWFVISEKQRPRRVAIPMLILIGAFITISPWIIWASMQRGELVLVASSSSGTIVDGLTYAVDDGFPEGSVSAQVAALQHRILAANPQSSSEIASVLLDELQYNPLIVLETILVKFTRNWYGTYSGRNEVLSLALHLPFFVIAVVGTIGSWRDKQNRWFVILNWLCFAYFLVMSTLVNTNVRYLAPVMGLILIFTPGVTSLMRRSKGAGSAIAEVKT